jgi:DNA polymerase-3 subunit epsilon
MKIFYFDLETTGFDPVENGIIQLGAIIEINGTVKEELNFKLQPFGFMSDTTLAVGGGKDIIDPKALSVSGQTMEDIARHRDPAGVYNEFIQTLKKYINKFDKEDKFYPAGYNVRFDLDFLAAFFSKVGDPYFGSWFNWRAVDALAIVRFFEFCGDVSTIKSNQKLETVCEAYGIKLEAAHNALSDIRATRELLLRLKNHAVLGLIGKSEARVN